MTALTRPGRLAAGATSRLPDRIFRGGSGLLAFGVIVLLAAIGLMLFASSISTWQTFGLSFITGTEWDPVASVYGALPFIVGTLMTSLLALLIAAPIGLLTAIFLAELAPRRIAVPVSFLIELLAAIPSVVIGLWGVFVLSPILRDTVEDWIASTIGQVRPVLRRADLRDRDLRRERDPGDHDPADHRVDLARGHPRRPGQPARGDAGARRDPLGDGHEGRPAVRPLGHRRGDHPGPRSGAWRDDGRDHGHRQQARRSRPGCSTRARRSRRRSRRPSTRPRSVSRPRP